MNLEKTNNEGLVNPLFNAENQKENSPVEIEEPIIEAVTSDTSIKQINIPNGSTRGNINALFSNDSAENNMTEEPIIQSEELEISSLDEGLKNDEKNDLPTEESLDHKPEQKELTAEDSLTYKPEQKVENDYTDRLEYLLNKAHEDEKKHKAAIETGELSNELEKKPTKLRLQKNIGKEKLDGKEVSLDGKLEKNRELSEDTIKQIMLYVNGKMNLDHPITEEQYKRLGGIENIANFLSTDEASKKEIVKKFKSIDKKFEIKDLFKNTEEFNDRSRRLLIHYNLMKGEDYPITLESYNELGRSEGIMDKLTDTEEQYDSLEEKFRAFSRNITEEEIDLGKVGIEDISRLTKYLTDKEEKYDSLQNEIDEAEAEKSENLNNFKYVELHNLKEEIVDIKKKIKELTEKRGPLVKFKSTKDSVEEIEPLVLKVDEDMGHMSPDELKVEVESTKSEESVELSEEDKELQKRAELFQKIDCDFISKFNDKMAKIKIGEKYSFVNESGVTLDKKYDSVQDYFGGLAAVEEKGKFFHIDKEGNKAYKETYEDIRRFSNGLAAVKKHGAWRFIDEKGDDKFHSIFQEAWSFDDGIAVVKKDDRYYYLDENGVTHPVGGFDYASKFTNGIANIRADGVYRQINRNYEPVSKSDATGIYKSLSILDDNGYSFASSFGGSKYFFVNEKGERVDGDFDEVLSLSEGIGLVKVKNEETKLDEYFYYDVENKQKIEIEETEGYVNSFEEGKYFSEGLAAVKIDGKWQFIDKKGKLAIKEKFDDVMSFRGSVAKVEKNGESFFINKKGERVFE